MSDRAIAYLYYLNQFREGAWYCWDCKQLVMDNFCRECGTERPARRAVVGNCITCHSPIYEGDSYCGYCGAGEWVAGVDDKFDEWVKVFTADKEEARRLLEVELAEAGIDFVPTTPEAVEIMAAREEAEAFATAAEQSIPEEPDEPELTADDLHFILRRNEDA